VSIQWFWEWDPVPAAAVTSALISLLGSAIIPWISKEWWGAKYKNRLDNETERLKSELHRTATKINHLSINQFDVYRALWQKAALSRDSVLGLYGLSQIGDVSGLNEDEMIEGLNKLNFQQAVKTKLHEKFALDPEMAREYYRERLRDHQFSEAQRRCGEAFDYLTDNEILLPESGAAKCRGVLKTIWSLFAQYQTTHISRGHYTPNGEKEIKKKIEAEFNELSDIIRNELGVAQPEKLSP
jgi:hypothetical protein